MGRTISVITPVLNNAAYIRENIESVRGQDYPHVEHIVVDGVSTDGTLDIVRAYPHLRWISEKDRGPGEAFAKGFALATGDILCLLPADDCLRPRVFGRVVRLFDAHPDCRWVAGYCGNMDADGRAIRPYVTAYKNLLLRHHSYRLLLTESYLSAPAVYFARDLLAEYGPFDIDACTEYDLWLAFAERHPLYVIRDELARFRLHGASDTGSFAEFPAWKAYRAARKRRAAHPWLVRLHGFNCRRLVFLYWILNRFLK